MASVVLGAPLVEETAKGIAVLGVLVLARHELDNTLDGLVYGALVGVGFAMTENVLYFGQSYLEGGLGDLGELFIARAVFGGFGHPAYTAVTGAAIGWARCRYGRGLARVAVPLLGWAIAVALHAAWNGGLVYTQFRRGDEIRLLQAVAVQAAVVIAPAVLVLYAVARLSARHELQILRDRLRDEVASGVLTDDGVRNHHRWRSEAARPCRCARTRREKSTFAATSILQHGGRVGLPRSPSRPWRSIDTTPVGHGRIRPAKAYRATRGNRGGDVRDRGAVDAAAIRLREAATVTPLPARRLAGEGRHRARGPEPTKPRSAQQQAPLPAHMCRKRG